MGCGVWGQADHQLGEKAEVPAAVVEKEEVASEQETSPATLIQRMRVISSPGARLSWPRNMKQ